MVLAPRLVHGQEHGAGAPVFVPPDHWAIGAVDRLHASGLLGREYDRGRRSPTQRELAGFLVEAVHRAEATASPLEALARSYLERFREEFGDGMRGVRGSRGWVGAYRHAGRLRTGFGYEDGYPNADWEEPSPAPDLSGPVGGGHLQWTGNGAFGLAVTVSAGDADPVVDAAYGAARLENVLFWVGRRAVGFGPSHAGGIVLAGDHPFDGLGIHALDGFRLPWLLRHLGTVHLEGLFARLRVEEPFPHPWLWAMRGSVAPHARLRLGASRAAIFGGEGNVPATFERIAALLVGLHLQEAEPYTNFENQVVSLDAEYRPPTERWLPLRLYLEWGFEDSAGAWKDTPGYVAGIEAPTLPGLPVMALGLERAGFSASCCGNPIWYRHAVFRHGWTGDGAPLGHPLGGHGRAWTGWVRGDLLRARVQVEVAVHLRDRDHENLFAPAREGHSVAGELAASVWASHSLELVLDGSFERGDGGWSEHRVRAEARWIP